MRQPKRHATWGARGEDRSPTSPSFFPSRSLTQGRYYGGEDRSSSLSPSLQEPLLHSTNSMSLEDVVNEELSALQKVLKHQMHDVLSQNLRKFNQAITTAVQNFEGSSPSLASLSMPVPDTASSAGYSPLHRDELSPESHTFSFQGHRSLTIESLREDEPLMPVSGLGGTNNISVRKDKIVESAATDRSYRTVRRMSTAGPFIPERQETMEDLESLCYEDLEQKSGSAQQIARHPYFANITLLVILANTIWMAVDTDYNHAEVLCQAAPIFQIVDNFFCLYFAFEICIRFFAYDEKRDALLDSSFCFDAILVGMMIWECWVQTIIFLMMDQEWHSQTKAASIFRLFRLFRLLRIARTVRLLRVMPELFILVKSIGAGIRCMIVTLFMLLLVIYVFAILFTTLLQGTSTGAGCFDSVPQAMNFMLLQVLTGFDKSFILKLLAQSYGYYSLWIAFMLIASLSIMNVLIGILCEVVSGTADQEKERATRKDMEQRIRRSCNARHAPLSKMEMLRILGSHPVAQKLSELQVDGLALQDAVNCLQENQELTVGEFAELVVQFRGGKYVTVRDLIDLRKFLTNELSYLEIEFTRMFALGCETKSSDLP